MGFPRVSAPTLLVIFCLSTLGALARAEQLISRSDLDLSDSQGPQLYSHTILGSTNSDGRPSVSSPVLINGALGDTQSSVWGFAVSSQGRRVVYGASSPVDPGFDDLFVVDLRNPGVAERLNPQRDVAAQSPFSFATNRSGHKVAYSLRLKATATDQLWVSDVRRPGSASLVFDGFATGTQLRDLRLAPDGSFVVYLLSIGDSSPQLWLSYLTTPTNARRIDTLVDFADRRATELVITPDSRRVLWRARGRSDQSEPLLLVEVDAMARTVSAPVRVNGGAIPNERVYEFELKPESSDTLAYRSVSAGDTAPGGVYVASLSNPGTAVQRSPAAASGASFTTWEDIEWFGDTLVYNSAQTNAAVAEVFSVGETGAISATKILGSSPLSATTVSSSVAGAAHLFRSVGSSRVAIVDGVPAQQIFTLDPQSPASVNTPFEFAANESIGAPGRPIDPLGLGVESPRNRTFSQSGEFIALHVDETGPGDQILRRDIQVANTLRDSSDVRILHAAVSGANFEALEHLWIAPNTVSESPETQLAAAVLPSSRSGREGTIVTAFVTILNAGAVPAENCSIDLLDSVPASLSYQATNPQTNALIGSANSPVSILPNSGASFLISIRLDGVFEPLDAGLAFQCDNAPPVTPLAGINTLLLSSSASPTADVIALVATPSNDGIVRLNSSGVGFFSVSSINVGDSAALLVSAETFGDSIPVNVQICQTDPATAACINPQSPSTSPVSLSIANGEAPTFSVFASASEPILADAARRRVRVVFTDLNGEVRGATSVAVQSN